MKGRAEEAELNFYRLSSSLVTKMINDTNKHHTPPVDRRNTERGGGGASTEGMA